MPSGDFAMTKAAFQYITRQEWAKLITTSQNQ
jgi:hypothetical protein